MGTASPPFDPAERTSNPPSRSLLVSGTDGRVQVKKKTFPYTAVGKLVGQNPKKAWINCSGALLGPDTVFTAGKQLARICLGLFGWGSR